MHVQKKHQDHYFMWQMSVAAAGKLLHCIIVAQSADAPHRRMDTEH